MRAGWEERPLGDLCAILDSRRRPITKRDRVPGEIPYYGATGVLDYVSGFIFDEPLVLVGEDGAKWGVGERTAFPVDGPTWINNHAHVLRPNRSVILDKWLIYYLNNEDLSAFITGLTVPKLNQEMLRSIPVPLPPLAEQQRIVAILDEAFEAIAAATANAEKNLANARELVDGYMTAVLLGLDGHVPSVALAEVCRRVTVGHVGSMAHLYKQRGIPFLRSQNIRPFHVDLTDVKYIDEEFDGKLEKSRLRPGDVAIVRTGYPGTAAVIPVDLPVANCADLVIVRPGSQLSADYLAMFLNSSIGKTLVGVNLVGAAQKHFNVGAAKQAKLPLPALAEQTRVTEQVRAMRAGAADLERLYTRKLAALAELKQSLLARAFSGARTADHGDDAPNIPSLRAEGEATQGRRTGGGSLRRSAPRDDGGKGAARDDGGKGASRDGAGDGTPPENQPPIPTIPAAAKRSAGTQGRRTDG